MPRARRILLTALLTAPAIAACGGSSDASAVAKDAESWTASSALIGERWRARTIPTAYTHRSLDAAGKSLQQTGEMAAHLPDTTRERAWLMQRVKLVRQAVAALDSAVARGDRGATSQPIGALAIDRHVLDSVGKASGGGE
jgi:hypothetical protein